MKILYSETQLKNFSFHIEAMFFSQDDVTDFEVSGFIKITKIKLFWEWSITFSSNKKIIYSILRAIIRQKIFFQRWQPLTTASYQVSQVLVQHSVECPQSDWRPAHPTRYHTDSRSRKLLHISGPKILLTGQPKNELIMKLLTDDSKLFSLSLRKTELFLNKLN